MNEIEDKVNKIYEIYPKNYIHSYNAPIDIGYKKISANFENEKIYSCKYEYNDVLYYGGFRDKDTLVYYDNGEYYKSRNNYGYETLYRTEQQAFF